MFKNIKKVVDKFYNSKMIRKIDYTFEAAKISHTPKEGESTGFIEGSKLRSPDGVVWVVENNSFRKEG